MTAKLAECPAHGRDHLANAGAPFVVRCTAPDSCGCGILERCRRCRGEGIAEVAFGMKRVASACPDCKGSGWRQRQSSFGSPYPVS